MSTHGIGRHLPQQLLLTQTSAQARFCFHISKLVVISKVGMNESWPSSTWMLLKSQCINVQQGTVFMDFPLVVSSRCFIMCVWFSLVLKGNFLPSVIRGFVFVHNMKKLPSHLAENSKLGQISSVWFPDAGSQAVSKIPDLQSNSNLIHCSPTYKFLSNIRKLFSPHLYMNNFSGCSFVSFSIY